MKVKELIEELQRCNPEADVEVDSDGLEFIETEITIENKHPMLVTIFSK